MHFNTADDGLGGSAYRLLCRAPPPAPTADELAAFYCGGLSGGYRLETNKKATGASSDIYQPGTTIPIPAIENPSHVSECIHACWDEPECQVVVHERVSTPTRCVLKRHALLTVQGYGSSDIGADLLSNFRPCEDSPPCPGDLPPLPDLGEDPAAPVRRPAQCTSTEIGADGILRLDESSPDQTKRCCGCICGLNGGALPCHSGSDCFYYDSIRWRTYYLDEDRERYGFKEESNAWSIEDSYYPNGRPKTWERVRPDGICRIFCDAECRGVYTASACVSASLSGALCLLTTLAVEIGKEAIPELIEEGILFITRRYFEDDEDDGEKMVIERQCYDAAHLDGIGRAPNP